MAFVDEESWAAVLDGVAAGTIPAEDFLKILLARVEQERGSALDFKLLEAKRSGRGS